MIGKVYKTIDIPGSRLLKEGILQVTKLEPDTVHYKYLLVEGEPHVTMGNDYSQGILHFKNHTIELTDLEAALI
jgi:hypothetical protein